MNQTTVLHLIELKLQVHVVCMLSTQNNMAVKNALHTKEVGTWERERERERERFSELMQFYDNDILALRLMIPWRVQSYKYVESELTTALISFYYLPWFFLDATQSSVVS